MSTRVARWGNSLAIRIPQFIATRSGIVEGATLEFAVEENKVIIERRHYTLDELVRKIKPENRHAEIATHKPRGKEQW